jgi:hypothetical protein
MAEMLTRFHFLIFALSVLSSGYCLMSWYIYHLPVKSYTIYAHLILSHFVYVISPVVFSMQILI